MATIKKFDMCVAVRKYTGQDGKTKNVYQNIGSIMEKDGEMFGLLNRTLNIMAVPFKEGSDTITISFFAPKDKSGATPQPAQPAPQQGAQEDDIIPF
jgi:hypothetical protein